MPKTRQDSSGPRFVKHVTLGFDVTASQGAQGVTIGWARETQLALPRDTNGIFRVNVHGRSVRAEFEEFEE